MWKIPVPTCDNVEEELETALTYANGSRKYSYSESQKARLLSVYAKYDEIKGRPERALVAGRLGPRFLEALMDAYDEVQDGKRLGSLRQRLKLDVQKCPYCGFGEVRDLDHQLPITKYRALAIYPRNLVPCCHPCNNKKRAVAGVDPDSHFPHVYLDEIPGGQFFLAEADVSEEGLRVQFSVRQCAGMSDELFQRLTFLVERLELEKRYQAEVITFITSHRTALEQAAGAGVLREFLERSVANSTRDYGLNHWQTALWRCLANSDAYCNGGYRHSFGLRHVGA